jgi:ABC-type sugar transport system permease subunit
VAVKGWQRRSRLWLRVMATLAVVAIAVLLRLRAVDRLPIDYDEDDYLLAGQQYAQALRAGDWAALTELNYRPEHPPLAKIVYGLALWRLPEAELVADRPTTAGPAASLPEEHLRAARLASAFAGVLEVLVLAVLSPLAGLLLAVHTFTIKYTSQVMLEALPALTSIVAVWAYERSRRRWNGWWALSAIALGLTASSKYIFCLVGVAIIVHWLWQELVRPQGCAAGWRCLWTMLSWGLLAVLVFVASDPYLWPAPLERLRESLSFHAGYTQTAAVQEANYPVWQPLVWLAQSVPWHPGVFVVAADGLITLLALLGLPRLWRTRRLYVIWLVVGLGFLFIWPTKWPQYILVLTAPLSLAAATGVKVRVWEPLTAWWRRRVAETSRRDVSAAGRRVATVGPGASTAGRRAATGWRAWRVLPWLLPGLVVLLLITFYPLLYQGGMALTDFSAASIKDGINGGIAREVREGLSGQAEPKEMSIFAGRSLSKEVHWVGIRPLLQVFTGVGADLLVFEVIWTISSVSLQVALGVALALLLHRQGVRLKAFWQTIFILPWAIPEFVGALIWMLIADPTYGWFFLSSRATFSEAPGYPLAQTLSQWQQNPSLALLVLLLAGTWLGFPLIMLAASAGLKMIPTDVYDAAEMDGARAWQRFKSITWPLLLPLLAPALIIRGILAFNQFYLFWTMQTPWPALTFATVSYFVFDESGLYAVSAMINVLTVLCLVGFLLWFNRQSRAGEGVTYA